MKEIKNFLPIEQFKKLQNLILNLDFPWRIRESMTPDDNNIYFTYSFFNENKINSELYNEYMIPILIKLKCKALIQIRANMSLNKFFNKSGWHTDYRLNNTTAILYINNCNGVTEFKINEKIKSIKPEENKIVIFSSKIEHRACTSTDVDRRYVINFNYF
jgi:hypothetical protein